MSTAAQLGNATEAYVPPLSPPPEAQYQSSQVAETSQDDIYAEAFCKSPSKECQNTCWTDCSSGSTWYCGSSGARCCQNNANFCADKCWTQCPSDYIWVCTSSGAICEPKSKCTSSGYPYPCGGKCWNCPSSSQQFKCDSGTAKCEIVTCKDPSYPNQCENNCWSGCTDTNYKDFTFACNNGKRECVFEKCIHPDYPNKCGNECWSNCPSGKTWNCKSDGTAECISNCVDNDGDGYGSGCSKGSDCNDNDANINPGKSEVCGDGKDNDCDGLTDENCCPSDNPYYCAKTEPKPCWNNKERCDSSIKCGDEWWACNEPSTYNAKCVDNKPGCCLPQHPYYCPANNWCFSSDGFCDGRPVYDCNSKYQVCNKKTDVGQCFGDVLRCCPSGESWWESDKQCHKSSEPQKCAVPDGSSANCDCDSDSDCPSSSGKPYCGEGSGYDQRTQQGFNACLSAKPKFCGDGSCEGSETYSNCQADCGQNAPKGTINVDVYYSSGANINKPISGASVSLDGVSKGTTDSSGKKSFEASYGNRNIKVECPDRNLCETRTVNVDGDELASFGCGCNPLGDSDGDGYSDKDEELLGTNPNDASSNFGSTFASDSVDLLACIPTPALFFILWKEYKKSGSIIQSHSLVVNSLNTTSITSASLDEGPYFFAQALAAAGFEAEGAEIVVNPVDVTLENVMKKAEYVDGVRMQDGLLLIATDKDGQTTALIAIGAGCVGAFTGSVYGIGQGVFDDIKGVIDGIWFLITHLDDVKKIWSGAVELVNGIRELFSKPGEAFWSMFTGILEKGQGINLFKDNRVNNPDPYRHFQVGFVYGFVTGYLVEQVALGAVILSKVAKFFKLGQLFGKTGKVTKLLEKLDAIKKAEDFGAEIAEKLSKLKYLKEGIDNWLDSEIKGLARIMKHNENWLKGLSEAEAKVAAKHADELAAAGKVTDAAFGDLTKTKLAQHTLKSADATTDLLAKQSKLVEKWGVKKADDVVSKCVFGICYGNRIEDLNKIVKAMPENIVDDFTTDRAVKFLGDKKFVEAAEKLSKLCNSAGVSSLDFGPAAVQTCLTLFTKVDDFEDAVKGAKAVASHIDDISKIQLPANELPETLQKLGKIVDVDGAKGLDGPAKRITTANAQGAKGIQAEISRASFIKGGGNTGENIAAVSKKVETTLNGEKVSQEVDIISDFTFSGKKTNILEEVKTGEISLGDVDKQFERYGELLKVGDALYDGKKIKVSKVRVVVAKGGTITEPAKNFAESNGLEVLDWVE